MHIKNFNNLSLNRSKFPFLQKKSGKGPFKPVEKKTSSKNEFAPYVGDLLYKIKNYPETERCAYIRYMRSPPETRKKGNGKKMVWTAMLESFKAAYKGDTQLFAKHYDHVRLPVGHFHARNGFQYEKPSQQYRYERELEKFQKAKTPFPWSSLSAAFYDGNMFLTDAGKVKFLKSLGGGKIIPSTEIPETIQKIRLKGQTKQNTLPTTNTLDYSLKDQFTASELSALTNSIIEISQLKPSDSHHPFKDYSLPALCRPRNHAYLISSLKKLEPSLKDDTLTRFAKALTQPDVYHEVTALGNYTARQEWQDAMPDKLRHRWGYPLKPKDYEDELGI